LTRRLITLALVSAVLFAACTTNGAGSSPTDPTFPTTTVPGTTTTTAISRQAIEAFRRCLSDDGVDIEPITFDAQGRPRLDLAMIGVDFTDPESSAVVAGCSEYLTTGALDLTESPLIGSGVKELLVEFSECVRSRGVPDFPDPVPGFTGIGGPYPVAEIPYSDPDLEAAIVECRDRLSSVAG
jgi:hypothetical protein